MLCGKKTKSGKPCRMKAPCMVHNKKKKTIRGGALTSGQYDYIVARYEQMLKPLRDAWRKMRLSEDHIPYLFLNQPLVELREDMPNWSFDHLKSYYNQRLRFPENLPNSVKEHFERLRNQIPPLTEEQIPEVSSDEESEEEEDEEDEMEGGSGKAEARSSKDEARENMISALNEKKEQLLSQVADIDEQLDKIKLASKSKLKLEDIDSFSGLSPTYNLGKNIGKSVYIGSLKADKASLLKSVKEIDEIIRKINEITGSGVVKSKKDFKSLIKKIRKILI